MSDKAARQRLQAGGLTKGEQSIEGLMALAGIVALLWIIEIFNTLDHNDLRSDGIYARNIGRIWGILTSPLIHASFQHLIDNSIPFIFMGIFIALRGAARLLSVTALVALLGGLGTWLISPAGVSTIGASGVVFGYATYLLTRGIFDRNLLELFVGVVVGVVWGSVLIASLVPHQGISWQAHVCGGVAGVIVAYGMSQRDHRGERRGGSHELASAH
jgi:membrane associated rhomboid family serine protease